ncbi:MAG: glycoside hydrolase family 3 C-terminal domain-containing protein [Clostridiales bacterium]|nr:glycoside hydrolase family 3 C-terminal domain-containing protein [Clostridiales bacterium]
MKLTKLPRKKVIAWSICFPIIAIIVATIIVITSLAYAFSDELTAYLSPPVFNKEALQAARAGGEELSKQIVQEGSVLVKNDGNVLPLDVDDDAKVNVFGWSSTDWVYGGSGSGQVFTESDGVANTSTILDALDEYGIEYNKNLTAFYKKYQARIGDVGSISTFQSAFYRLCEPSISADYDKAVLSEAESFSKTALVTISRRAGETEDPTRVQYKIKKATDNSRTYLEISTEEEELLTYVGSKYDKVIVIINSTNVMELGFMDTIPGLDACLVVGATGTNGALGIPSVLYGVDYVTDEDGEEVETAISPSGRFSDTYAYDFESNINFNFSGDAGVGHYTGADELYPVNVSRNAGEQYTTATYVDYIEGIYVGYKWFETADKMGVWKSKSREILGANGAKKTVTGYDAVVQYPFGYGLSYTTFDWELISFKIDGKEVKSGAKFTDKSALELSVKVTNTGKYAGKDVVEVYLTAPYTDGGIEKSYVSLVGFAKTASIAPGGSQDITIALDPFDFASYDCYDKNNNDFKGYELEAGKYEIKLMTDAHRVKQLVGGSGVFELNVDSTIKIDKDPVTGNDVFNKFTGEDAKEDVPIDGSEASTPVQYITRAAFPDPYTFKKPADRAITEAEKIYNLYSAALANEWNNAETDLWGNELDIPEVFWGTVGKYKIYENGKVTELGMELGKDYDSPIWDGVLAQVSISEALGLAENGGFGNRAVSSIGKPALKDYDGPAQVRSFNAGNTKGTGFPCSATMSQTWSTSLVYSFGLNYGKEMDMLEVDGAYAFGCNIHRNPFAGRNYEYLSEDGFLTAALLTQEVKGLKNTGKYTYLKHLVLGECEHDREAMYTWLTEQALREIYLKPFHVSIQKGGCVGIMTSYNRIGSIWTGGSESLISGIVRGEWGFNGVIVTDYSDHPAYMSGDQSVRAGGDLSMAARFYYGTINESAVKSNPRLAYQMKEIVHHVTYAYLSAQYAKSQYNEDADVEQILSSSSIQSWVWWKPALAVLNIVVWTGCAYWVYFLLRPKKFLDGTVAAPILFCVHCGAELVQDARFCENCGAKIDDGGGGNSDPPDTPPDTPPDAEAQSPTEAAQANDAPMGSALEESEPAAAEEPEPEKPEEAEPATAEEPEPEKPEEAEPAAAEETAVTAPEPEIGAAAESADEGEKAQPPKAKSTNRSTAKSGTAKSGGAKGSTAKSGTAKSGGAKGSTAKSGTTKGGSTKGGATKGSTAKGGSKK